MDSMEDILKEPEKTEVAPETPSVTTEAPEVEKAISRKRVHQSKEWAEQGRDPETGQYISKEPPKEEQKEEPKPEVKEPPKVELTDKEKAYLKAVEEERRKRHELERRLAALEAKPTSQPVEGEKKTFWDDPEGHLKNFEQRFQQQGLQLRLQTSEQIARSKYKDFDEVLEVFGEILRSPAGPGIHAQFLAAPDPGEFAYRLGRHTKELRDVGSLDAMRQKIVAEERAKLEAEFKAKEKEIEKQRAALVPSLSDVKGAAKQSVPVFTGPTPMSDILGRS